jgi:hypothetical protein
LKDTDPMVISDSESEAEQELGTAVGSASDDEIGGHFLFNSL